MGYKTYDEVRSRARCIRFIILYKREFFRVTDHTLCVNVFSLFNIHVVIYILDLSLQINTLIIKNSDTKVVNRKRKIMF